MKEITLEQPIEVLKINVGEKSFSMPLAGSIPFVDLMRFKTAKSQEEKIEAMMSLLQQYIPDDIYKTLSSNAISQIMTVWGEASQTDTGVTPGES